MFRKLVLAASAAAALGATAIAFSAPAQARDWDRNGSVYDQTYVRDHHQGRRWNNDNDDDDDDDGYRRPQRGWGWGGGWHRPRYSFAPAPYWNGGWQRSDWRRSYWAPRHRWFDNQEREW